MDPRNDEETGDLLEVDEIENLVDKPAEVRKLLDYLIKKTEGMEQRLERLLEEYESRECDFDSKTRVDESTRR